VTLPLLRSFALALAGLVLPWTLPASPPNPADFELDPRLEIKLWAAEPLVVDPVSLGFDAEGRAFVAECRDYPNGVGPNGKVGSTVRLLVDTDGDGVADQSTIFAKDLSFATSVTPWRGGVLVLAPPDLLYLQDTNRDGVADVREVILTGFTRGVSDSLANGLRYGLDGRIHAVNGGNGGKLSSPLKPGVETDLGENDFAVNPTTGEVELTAHTGGGFGLVFDDFGHGFTTYNINHLQHYFLLRRYADRFPGFPPVELTGSISDHEEMSRIYPVSVAQTRPNHPEQAGHFSAAGGMGRIATPLLPADLRDSVLVCDVVGNLVHRDVITPEGPMFVASRASGETDREFLAGRDPAFRPVGLEVGPDGALYLLDMQRDVIEHPDYIPDKMKAKLDLRAGADRGRIWRITPKGGLPTAKPALTKATDSALVRLLNSPIRWWRLTAQRLLLERGATGSIPEIRRFSRESADAECRLQALWTLRGLGALNEEDVGHALHDGSPGVRENALILAEPFLPAAESLQEPLLALAQDPFPRVRFQCALTLGLLDSPIATETLLAIYREDATFRWTRLAVIASLRPANTRFLFSRILALDRFRYAALDGPAAALADLAELVGARAGTQADDVNWLLLKLDSGLNRRARLALLDGLMTGLTRSGARPRLSSLAERQLGRLTLGVDAEELRSVWLLTRWFGLPESEPQRRALTTATRAAAEAARPLPERVTAIRLLGLGSEAAVTNALVSLLDALQPEEVQSAALATLSGLKATGIGPQLVDRWRTVSPALRTPLLAVVLDRRAFHEPLLAALEAGRITVGELNLDLEQRRRLLRESTAEIQQRAAKFFGDEEYSNRKAVVTEWLAKVPPTGDAAHGRKIFEETCSRCHFAGGFGHKVGPELSGVAHRSVEDLLSNILDPNMAINPGFVAYTVETKDGESQTGLLTAQTSESVTLLQAMEVKVVIPRTQIVKLGSNGQSLMPEGLEAGKTPQDLRDLVAFLQGSK
jgi:putative membrane-bound dehydrogenase-like protein